MTVLRLALSATMPGTWTSHATSYHYTDTIGPADTYGTPVGNPATQMQATVNAGAATLPYAAKNGVYEQQVLTQVDFGGTKLQADSGLVTINSYTNLYGLEGDDYPGYLQTIVANGPWNLIKDIAVSTLSSQALTIRNFVDVQVDTGTDMSAHLIDIEDAKRGTIVAVGSQEAVTINYLSNEYAWSNTFQVRLGDGSNHLVMGPLGLYPGLINPLTPMTFNTAPQHTLLQLQTGNGQNVVDTRECSASINLGHGSNTVSMLDGHNEIWSGGGTDTISIASHAAGETIGVDTDIGIDMIHLSAGLETVFLDDTNRATMPHTSVELTALPVGIIAPAATIWYGHGASGNMTLPFAGGDWSHLTLDLHGFSAGSHVSLVQHAANGYSALSVQDTHTGATRVVDLVGAAPPLSALHLVWN